MPRTKVEPQMTIESLIALWLLIHEGDPAPGERELMSAIFIQRAASNLQNKQIGRQISALARQLIVDASR